MNRALICIAVVACTPGIFAQSPAFDIADVHVSARSVNPAMRGGFLRGGRYELHTATMVDLIRTAYGVEPNNVTGGPAWLETNRFDVIATAPATTTPENLKLMLQSLLADRFKLVVHNDAKPLSGYVLTSVKRSSQMKDADPASEKHGCANSQAEPTPSGVGFVSYSCHNVTMDAFAAVLRGMAPGYTGGNPITNQTELKGSWDFDIKWNGRGQLAAAGSDGISLFGAIEKLGLKLELKNVSQPVIAVDSVNEKPTDNLPGVTKALPVISLEFEVADIKPSAPETKDASGGIQPNGRVDIHGMTMRDLISAAWEIDDDATISGGPKWIDADRFDVVAKASTSVSASGQQLDFETVEMMLRTLLAERFKLAVHMEDRPVTVYALVAAKPKMKKADPSNRTACRNIAAGSNNLSSTVSRTFNCQNISMVQFADKLGSIAGGYIDHPVIDLSGLEGSWDFTVNFSPKRALQIGGRGGDASQAQAAAGAAADPNGAISLFEAIDKQLGMKLEQQKHPMPVIVIDHVEEKPTEN